MANLLNLSGQRFYTAKDDTSHFSFLLHKTLAVYKDILGLFCLSFLSFYLFFLFSIMCAHMHTRLHFLISVVPLNLPFDCYILDLN